MKRTFSLVAFALATLAGVLAQTPKTPQYKGKSYVDSAGQYYQQAALPTYVYVSTSPDDAPTGLAVEGKQVLKKKKIQLDGHGVHYLRHHNSQTHKDESFRVNADGVAPVTAIRFLNAPQHRGGGQQYYGQGLSVTLTPSDEMSGVNGTLHTLGAAEYSDYSPLPFNTEGAYTYRYYTVDNVGNAESPKTNRFTVDLTPPRTYHNIVGISSRNVISTNTTLYLTKADSLAGVAKTLYRFDAEPYRPYTGGTIPFRYLADGDHTLAYYSVDLVSNRETENTTQFYLDKTAPIMSADVLGDRFIVGDKVYFSGRTKLKLTAVDNKSGVKKMLFSIDDAPFNAYAEPFYLPGKSGLHTVRYYAEDNTQNLTTPDVYKHTVGLIYVDLTGPALTKLYSGPVFEKGDTTYVSPLTRVSLSATDPESGLNRITYSLDGQADETVYKQPFSLSESGSHTIQYYGYDNVSNRNVKQAVVRVDARPPDIHPSFGSTPQAAATGDETETYPSYVTLYLAATDQETGSQSLSYSINGGPVKPYTAPVKGFRKRTEYRISIIATDWLGNRNTKEVQFKTGKF